MIFNFNRRLSPLTSNIFLLLLAGATTVFYFAVSKANGMADSWLEQNLEQNKTTQAIWRNEAIIKTSMGDIKIKLLEEKAPATVTNFIKLAKSGFYDNTKFHRVISDFMIQGGDPLSKDDTMKEQWGTGGPGYKFDDEISDEPLVKGIVAMANSGPSTNGSQFFIITTSATPWLQGKHTAFGRVIFGMDIVDKISTVSTDARDIPIQPITVEKIILK
ncbi:MAG TPA: peptidylprolyl isomerase [Candidatus Paceibacterota bacterium]